MITRLFVLNLSRRPPMVAVCFAPEDWKMANEMIDRLERCGLVGSLLSSGNYQVEFNEMIGL